jgi:hypothetical protein
MNRVGCQTSVNVSSGNNVVCTVACIVEGICLMSAVEASADDPLDATLVWFGDSDSRVGTVGDGLCLSTGSDYTPIRLLTPPRSRTQSIGNQDFPLSRAGNRRPITLQNNVASIAPC